MKLGKLSTTLHKWIGLVIGIQVFLWIVGGLVMTWFDLEIVRGEHNIAEQAPITLGPDSAAGMSNLLAARADISTVRVKGLLGQAYYEAITLTGERLLFDAASGDQVSPISADFAARVAVADFAGEAAPSEPTWIEEHNLEYRGPLPVWQVILNDEEGTHLYVSPTTGAVIARRNSIWRVFDFFWMLHIMDYENRTDFNHPLVVWMSVFATILAITGIILIFFRFTKRDFRFLRKKNS